MYSSQDFRIKLERKEKKKRSRETSWEATNLTVVGGWDHENWSNYGYIFNEVSRYLLMDWLYYCEKE